MEIPKLPTIKELVPYILVACISGMSAMWLRLGENDINCDARIEKLSEFWQAKYERQEARLDTANAIITRIQAQNAETFKRYFEMSAKLKRK